MREIVKVDNLCKTFKNTQAVCDLSFTVNEGDIFGFLGQNGAGKSTTMRMMLGLVKPTKGSIHIFDKNIAQYQKSILKQTGSMIERADFYKYLSAYQNINIFAKLSGLNFSKNDLLQKLDMVGLADRAFDKVGGFSQGMKQRLAISIALVHNPRLLILDEPTNGLDPQGIADIRFLIKELSKTYRKTVIVSSHLLSEIEQIANRILIVDKGRKVAEGFTEELISPNNIIVIFEVDDIEKSIRVIASLIANKPIVLSNTLLELKIDKDKIPDLVNRLVNEGVNIYSIKHQNALENYFINLTAITDV